MSGRTRHPTPPLGMPTTSAPDAPRVRTVTQPAGIPIVSGSAPTVPITPMGVPVTPMPLPQSPVPSMSPSPNSGAPVGVPSSRQAYEGGALPTQPIMAVKYPAVGAVLRSPHGAYEVRAVIGSGQFGAVYECIGPFDQIYAMKMERPANRPYHEVHAEWAREVQRLMTLRHPNVVYIYDAFEQDYLFYLALERCDHPLSAMLGTPMQEGLVIELARQLLAAVQFLHDNDVVHDDLHPGNVLITHNDRPVVKISDFGISHELRGAPAVRPNVVHHRIMAPEILASGYTSKQSDLYQVGLLLYWMLTGHSSIPLEASYEELIRYVSNGEPRKRAEAIGTPLGAVVSKTLRRRDQFRYTSAREVWDDLRRMPAWQNRQLFPIK